MTICHADNISCAVDSNRSGLTLHFWQEQPETVEGEAVGKTNNVCVGGVHLSIDLLSWLVGLLRSRGYWREEEDEYTDEVSAEGVAADVAADGGAGH